MAKQGWRSPIVGRRVRQSRVVYYCWAYICRQVIEMGHPLLRSGSILCHSIPFFHHWYFGSGNPCQRHWPITYLAWLYLLDREKKTSKPWHSVCRKPPYMTKTLRFTWQPSCCHPVSSRSSGPRPSRKAVVHLQPLMQVLLGTSRLKSWSLLNPGVKESVNNAGESAAHFYYVCQKIVEKKNPGKLRFE